MSIDFAVFTNLVVWLNQKKKQESMVMMCVLITTIPYIFINKCRLWNFEIFKYIIPCTFIDYFTNIATTIH